jgi:TldD protein
VTPAQITDLACQTAAAALSFHQYVRRSQVAVNTGLSRQLFVSSQGSIIDQSSASSGVTVFVLAQNNQNHTPVDLYHHTGNQLGLEALTQAKNAHQKTAVDFARQIADEARLLADAKPAPVVDKPATVVLDPDLIALFAHEIIGHPSELDRAFKMETGYAGRSWFMTDLQNSVVGKQIGSPLLTAFSDSTLKGGYGYYLYDDEGTPARRVYHIKNGVYQDFINSRQTAPLINASPNGHYKANDASVVPLITRSVSAIAAGRSDPKKIIADVDHGYYCVGHRIPSISESRENFQIAPRLIYEINHGRLGRLYRDGRLTADSRDFFMSIDAVGTDFKIFPIPNCGKGQPMQAKQVGNGGPTARGKAMIARGK